MTEARTILGSDVVVGISVSEPSPEELIALGLSDLHVRHAFIEIVRHVLALGGSVAYGGDLRAAGYTEVLFDLVRAYNPRDLTGPDRVQSFLAWPIWTELTAAQRADLANVATIEEVQAPDGAPYELRPIGERSPEELLWMSRSLTKMRQEMGRAIGARVVLGGRVSGQQGLLPGVIEEAILALEMRRPLYVIGGFGGCGGVLARALKGENPVELTLDYQIERTPRYEELHRLAGSEDAGPPFDELPRMFREAGLDGLNNGLDRTENERLFITDDVDDLVALVLRGLRNLTGGSS
jgi:hypothetical protein